jgi:GNAT superfamily N-acetyltransferase
MADRTRIEVCTAVWNDVEALFGPAGASNGCWCQYWLLGAEYHRRDRAENRRDLARQVQAGNAGLLAYRDGAAVGWARFTPRSELAWLTGRFGKYDFGEGDPWSLSCFFVRRNARGAGVMSALIEFAVRFGRDNDVAVEGYPIDPAVERSSRNRFTGVLPVFLRAGFVEHGRLAPDRVVVRREATQVNR